MKEQFNEKLHLNHKNIEKLSIVNGIIEEYISEGYRLTLRQLYYQLVSRDIVPNSQKEYAKLSTLLVKGRMAGEVDWGAIEDRVRIPFLPYWVRSIKEAIDDTINQYRLDRMEGQENYIELWVEKDALSGVLKPITSFYHIDLMVNRGYSSCSAMYDSADRFKNHSGQKGFILYLGDHDPSGLDMIRDIEDRLSNFEVEVEVQHIGLTFEQIKKYNPPPNPAKFKDPRAKEYIEKFGKMSWEVDALNPKTLNALVKKGIENLIDIDLFKERIEQEKKDKKEMGKFAKDYK